MIPPSTELFMVCGGVIPAEYRYPERLDEAIISIGASQFSLAQLRPPTYVSLFWSLFLHANLLHLLVNLFFLYHLGRNVEAQMGGRRFLLFFLSCGAAGMAAQVVFDQGSMAPIVGASGAISGLMGAYLVLFPDHDFRLTIGQYHRKYRDTIFPFKVILLVWILNQAMLLLPDQHATQSIAVFAHLGGFVCGLLLARGRRDPGSRKKFKVVSDSEKGPFWGTD